VFIPHAGCPHHCAFCNQQAITQTSNSIPSSSEISALVKNCLRYLDPDRKPVQIAFFGGNFLGIKSSEIIRLLTDAQHFVNSGCVDSIRFSTRPDTITKEKMALLKNFSVLTIEIGAQSMNDTILEGCQRGHSAEDTVEAVHLVKRYGYEAGIQMMTGLPGDDESTIISTGRQIADLSPDAVRIYPAVVLENSTMAKWYRTGRYTPLSLAPTITLVKKLFLMFQAKNIPVIRMGLQTSTDLENGSAILAGPFHPAFGHLVMAEIYRDKIVQLLERHSHASMENVIIRTHPRRISVLNGLKKETVQYIERNFGIQHLDISGNSLLPDHHLSLTILSGNKEMTMDCSVFEGNIGAESLPL